MKRIVLITFMILSCISMTIAQEQGIKFEENSTWSKIVKKAKKGKKLIFIDCYTSWCGPCKILAKDVFTQKAVGEYFNANYINAKFDCEKGEGVQLKEKFKVPAFPTLVFYNPQTDEVEHMIVGAGKADWLLEHGKLAYDKENNLLGMTKRYENGSLESNKLGDYLNLLQVAYEQDKQSQVAVKYLEALTPEQLAEKENWTLLMKNVIDPQSTPMRKVIDNLPLFYEKIGKDFVDQKINYSLMNFAGYYMYWDPRSGAFNMDGYTNAVSYLKSLDLPIIPMLLAKMYITEEFAKENFTGMLTELKNYERYNFGGSRSQNGEIVENLRRLAFCKDEAIVKEGIDWISQIIANTSDHFSKASYYEVKAKLQNVINDTVGAEQSKLEAKKFDELGKKASGGKAMRAMRMN